MDKHQYIPEEARLESPLAEAVEAVRSEPIPEETVARVAERAKASRIRSKRRGKWMKRLAVIGATAALIVFGVLIFRSTSSDALAKVAIAVANRPWLHATGKGPGGRPVDFWFSEQEGIIASKAGKRAVFVDRRRGVVEIYGRLVSSAGKNTIHRLPREGTDSPHTNSARKSLKALLSGHLERAFQAQAQKIVSHDQRRVTVDGRKAIEHRFVVEIAEDSFFPSARAESTLRVDPATHLPFWWQLQQNGETVFECEISYPKDGPETIYALGVPRSAKVVDLVPKNDFRRLLTKLRTARRRFDSYRAVVLQPDSPDPRDSGNSTGYHIWRKGKKWRIEQFRLRRNGEKVEPPPDAAVDQWWLEEVKTLQSYPKAISDGQREWLFDTVPAEPRQFDPDNPGYSLIESLEKYPREFRRRPRYPRPQEHPRRMPGLYTYPSLWRATSPGHETRVDREPEKGPEGTVLVEIVRKATDYQREGAFSGIRYWIDPDRSYMVVRRERLERFNDRNRVDSVTEVIEAAQSPRGYWYPTLVRFPDSSVHLGTGETSDYYYRYFLDFDTEITDDLFDPSNASVP